jgi:hypothetical protein
MKPIGRGRLIIVAGGLLLAVAFAAGWLIAEADASAQQDTGTSEAKTEEPLPDFKPTERLPADSAVAFPTDI